ncbi:hypothetical protein IL306_015029 [Fusarium sp. DS 682]|nr:hypothetical protein IL306_015029 [Fusarium sp. DS 682]
MDSDHPPIPSVERPTTAPSQPPSEKVIFFSLHALYDYNHAENSALEECRERFPQLRSKSSDEIASCYRQAMKTAFTSHLNNSNRNVMGGTNKVHLLFHLLGLPIPEEEEDFCAHFAQVYSASLRQNRQVTTGAIECLEQLKQKGYKFALIEDGYVGDKQEIVDVIGLSAYIDRIFTSEPSQHRKPDKRLFESGLKGYNIREKDTWMVGVCEKDIEGIKAVGARPVLYDPDHPRFSLKPNYQNVYVVSCMDEVVRLVEHAERFWGEDAEDPQGRVPQPQEQEQQQATAPDHQNRPSYQQDFGFPEQSVLESSAQSRGSPDQQNSGPSYQPRRNVTGFGLVQRHNRHGSSLAQDNGSSYQLNDETPPVWSVQLKTSQDPRPMKRSRHQSPVPVGYPHKSPRRYDPRDYGYSSSESSQSSGQNRDETTPRDPVGYANHHVRPGNQPYQGNPPKTTARDRQERVESANVSSPNIPYRDRPQGLGEHFSRFFRGLACDVPSASHLPAYHGVRESPNQRHWESSPADYTHQRPEAASQYAADAPNYYRHEASPVVNTQRYDGLPDRQMAELREQERPRAYDENHYGCSSVQPEEVPGIHYGFANHARTRAPDRRRASPGRHRDATSDQHGRYPAYERYRYRGEDGPQQSEPRRVEHPDYRNEYSSHEEPRS